MSRILTKASTIALVATLLVTLLGTSGSSAAAEHILSAPIIDETNPVRPAAQPLNPDAPPASQADGAAPPAPTTPQTSTPTPPAIAASSLEQLVATQRDSGELTGDLKCLAGAIYFEARNESLEGQLAVGRVIVARTHSGRFPASYCGVVYQPSQFSFVRRAAMPTVDAQSHLWHRAVALAKIADAGSWQSPAEGALFFHAARVSAGWRMKRVTQIDHHIFYR
jgi:spore germination cell wall hydrolase CwlJ-like protein